MFKKEAVVVEKPTGLDLEINRILTALTKVEVKSEEYKSMVARLTELDRLRVKKEIKLPWWKQVSPDAMITVAGSLVGIIIIVWHEKADVITTKALGFVLKGRV